MSRKAAIVAFKVEEELANILNQLPNKSAFIRKAIVSQLDMACPVCRGTGVLAKGLHDHYARELARLRTKSCEGCGDKAQVPTGDAGMLAADHRERLEQFFHGGPFYCDDCFEKAPPCDDCGWHIGPGQAKKHVHAGES